MCCILPIVTSGRQAEPAPYAGTVENQVLAMALADLKTLPREQQVLTRYVWITSADWESLQAVSLTLNYISRATVARRVLPLGQFTGQPGQPGRNDLERVPPPIRRGPCLARVDLSHYAPQRENKDLEEFVRTWEELRFDPRFNLLLTKDTLKFAAGIDLDKAEKTRAVGRKRRVKKVREKIVDTEVYTGEDGKLYNWKRVQEEYWAEEEVQADKVDGDVLRVVGEHIDPLLLAQLVDLTRSQAPVVNHGYFMTRALTTIKDNGAYKTIWGGLYYDFAGIKKGFKKGTDFDNYLDKLGIGNVEQGLTAEKVFDQRRSDQRVAKFRSEIAGKKPRAIDFFRQLTGRIGNTQGMVSITHDVKRENIDIAQHAVMNLLKFKDDAREVISEKGNGLHEFSLFNGEGALQDFVPDTVAQDSTIPAPYLQVLQPPIGCIRCHLKDDGWRYAFNDVKKLAGGRLDIFGDLSDKKKTQPDVVDRLAGLYAGDLEFKLFPQGRRDYAANLLLAGGPWSRSKDAQADIVKLSGEAISREFAKYNYQDIGARQVLIDLGEIVERDPVKQLQRVLPPPAIQIDGIVPEDPRIGALTVGLETNRSDYDLSYAFIARRYQLHKAAQERAKKP